MPCDAVLGSEWRIMHQLTATGTWLGLEAGVGKLGDLLQGARDKIGTGKLINDFMEETKFAQENPNVLDAAKTELENRVNAAGDMRKIMNETKPEFLRQVMPEMTAENLAKVDSQMQNIYDHIETVLDKGKNQAYTPDNMNWLRQIQHDWLTQIQDPAAGFAEKFEATNQLKRKLSELANWNRPTQEESIRGGIARGEITENEWYDKAAGSLGQF